MNYEAKESLSAAVKAKGAELGMTPKACYVLARNFELALKAVEDAQKELADLERRLSCGDVDAALSELVTFAGHAGYSNSAMTACSELVAAAGAVSSLIAIV